MERVIVGSDDCAAVDWILARGLELDDVSNGSIGRHRISGLV